MAWEQSNLKLYILIPHLGSVTVEWCKMFFCDLIKPPNTRWLFGRGAPIDVTREMLVEDALKNNASLIAFIDSDVVPDHPDALIKLIRYYYALRNRGVNVGVISGLYWAKKPNPVLCAFRKVKGGYAPIAPKQPSNIVEVDVVGLGFSIVNPDVFSMPKPWFLWTQGRKYLAEKLGEDIGEMSEDFYFCEKIRKHGWKVLVCLDVKCAHIGMIRINSDGTVSSMRV